MNNKYELIEIKLEGVFINFIIQGAGWMDVLIYLNGKRFTVDWVSYVYSPFLDIANIAVPLKKQAYVRRAFIEFEREGSETYFIGLTPSQNNIEVSLYKGVPDTFNWDDEKVEKIETEIMEMEKFIHQCYSILKFVKNNFTEDNYIIGFDEFPEKEFTELEKLMSTD